MLTKNQFCINSYEKLSTEDKNWMQKLISDRKKKSLKTTYTEL